MRSKVELALGRRLVRVPSTWLDRLGGRLHVSIDGKTMDRRVCFALGLIDRASGGRGLHAFGTEGGREQMRRLPMLMDPPPPKVVRVDEAEFDGPRGMIRARIYVPPGGHAEVPTLVYFSWWRRVVGDLDTHDVPCRVLCREAECAVVSVDYGLAPEAPFPAGLEDCIAAFRWVRDHPDVVDSDGRIAVGGDSMGGKMAARVAIETRDDPEGGPCFQLLIYPLADVAAQTESRNTFARGFLLDHETIEWFNETYLGGAKATDPRASVLREPNLAGLAPAHIATAGFDPLRDEGHAYANALREAGVRVEERCAQGQVHGFLHMTGAVPSAARALEDLGRALSDGFASA